MKAIGDVITYPMESDDWLVTTLIGGVLLFLSVLIIPLLVVYGYLIDVIRGSLAGASEPSAFGDWGALLVDGLQAWIIGLIYMLVPLLVGGLTVGGSIAAMATGTEGGAAAGFGGFFLGILITSLVALLFGYLSVVALVNFAREGEFGAAFDVSVLKQVALTKEFAVPWLVSIVLFFVASFVNVIPFIGWLLAPFVGFYAAIVAADLWADGFDAALSGT